MAREVVQGDVWWVEFLPPDRSRPVVVLTRTSIIPHLDRVTIAPITTRIRSIPTEVVLTAADGFSETCVVNLDNLQTISKAKLRKWMTRLSESHLCEIREGVHFAFGFDLLPV